jgi:hypothetical protein
VWVELSNPEKLDLDISGSPDKSITPGNCGFPLANLQKGPGIDFVPASNPMNQLILLCICSCILKIALLEIPGIDIQVGRPSGGHLQEIVVSHRLFSWPRDRYELRRSASNL